MWLREFTKIAVGRLSSSFRSNTHTHILGKRRRTLLLNDLLVGATNVKHRLSFTSKALRHGFSGYARGYNVATYETLCGDLFSDLQRKLTAAGMDIAKKVGTSENFISGTAL